LLFSLILAGYPAIRENRENRKKYENNSLQGQIREFVKKENIRDKSGNFTRETNKYFVKENTSV
jgi:hypothetical protein